jgi:hypothetical protein
MNLFIKILSSVLAFIMFLLSSLCGFFRGMSTAQIAVDLNDKGEKVVNIVDNMNTWDMGTQFVNAENNSENDVFNFVDYIQLMQCTGGTAERDLFKNPYDTSVLTDYDFSRLIENCRGILKLGAKPYLTLGSVPLKFTSDYTFGGFLMNLYPPDDYKNYYNYIYAIASALVNEFGKDEVLKWRFGCMTEYENDDWFIAKGGDPQESAQAYCKLYDYTVQALTDAIGSDVFVGAHSMTVTQGLWDEEIFIKHVAEGKNYANGGTGTRICFLSASFYDMKPGQFTSGNTLPQTINYLKDCAQKYGLNNLIYGIDEGRILSGNSRGNNSGDLISRTVGFTWQAAYDARIYLQAIDSGANYFSSWSYLSGGIINGYPTVSYHVANNISKFAGCSKVKTNVRTAKISKGTEIKALSAVDEDKNILRIMVYNFNNDPNYSKKAQANITVSLPKVYSNGEEIKYTKYVVNDDCNFFDEWQADRKKYGITDSCFSWSPDDPTLDSTDTLSDSSARKIYETELRDKYAECSKLTPIDGEVKIKHGKIKISDKLDASAVVFYEIQLPSGK